MWSVVNPQRSALDNLRFIFTFLVQVFRSLENINEKKLNFMKIFNLKRKSLSSMVKQRTNYHTQTPSELKSVVICSSFYCYFTR